MELKIDEIVRKIEATTQDNQCYYLTDEGRFVWDDEPFFDPQDHKGKMISLPNHREINNYHIMEQFANGQKNPEIREWLQNSLIGKGAFRRFRGVLERFHITNEWYDFQQTAYEDIAVMWCEENGLVYNFSKYYDEEDDDEYYDDEHEEAIEEQPVVKKSNQIHLVDINEKNSFAISYMVSDFRIYLASLRGNKVEEDLSAADKEVRGYIRKGYPVFAVAENGRYQGYAVCRIDDDVVWLESLFVREPERRRRFGSALLKRAEEIAQEHGNDTLYIHIHPNNEPMIGFLHSKGYDVLNLLELRKKSVNEKLGSEYQIGDHKYRY
ncbi:MAG: GNAT family N-acetyltransferase [Erysipelotrichaceae bacterium]|nr:GNAT family N-acetyltransferase [Erysipelotrichaceae bacterium]